jgi:myo-inositol 2-dehydrogenase/D-chiro-inositol 1-dehydrogenase
MSENPQNISVGVIGTGAMGGTHARNIHSRVVGARVGAVMDIDLSAAEAVAAECGSPHIFRDADELINSELVDAILIASPDETHADYVLKCLEANKPTFCEKPLATTVADGQKIVEAEVELGRRLAWVGFVRRYDPQHLGVQQAIETGRIGRPVLFKGWHRNMAITVSTANEVILFNSAIHDLDSARWLLGQEIEQVYVTGTNVERKHGQDCNDLQLIQLSLSGGCLAIIEVDVSSAYGYEVGLEIVGDQGTALAGNPRGTIIRHNQNYTRHVEDIWFDRFEDGYIAEVRAWIGSILSNNHDGPDAWDGYLSLLAADTCIASLKSGLPQRIPPYGQPALYEPGG